MRTLLVVLAASLAFTGTLLLPPSRAMACSHPCGPGRLVLVSPADGEVGVPLNAILVLRWDDKLLDPGGPEPLVSVVLRGPDGAVVPATVTNVGWASSYMAAIELRPAAPLAPSTTYTVAYENDIHPVDEPLHARFTTGTVEDHEPPVLGPAALNADVVEACEAHSVPNCCYTDGPVRKQDLLASWPEAAGEPVVFGVREGDKLIARGLRAGTDPLAVGAINCDEAYIDCGFGGPQPFILAPGSHTLTLFAEDRAGNQVVLGESTIDGSCYSPEPGLDGGHPCDGGPGPGPAAEPEDDVAGCGCRVGGGRSAGWMALLAFVPLFRRRRRRASLGSCEPFSSARCCSSSPADPPPGRTPT